MSALGRCRCRCSLLARDFSRTSRGFEASTGRAMRADDSPETRARLEHETVISQDAVSEERVCADEASDDSQLREWVRCKGGKSCQYNMIGAFSSESQPPGGKE